jgi:transcription antitermination factor NusG
MVQQDPGHSWYAVHTRYQSEKTAAQILQAKGYEIFLPLYTARHKWQDRIKQVSLPLFPGYIFLRETLGRWLPILMAPGVCSIVGCAGRPTAIPFWEIEGVRRMVESALRVEPHPFLNVGDRVRVKFGPLAGSEGILLRKNNLTRLVLSVEMLGQSAAVDVEAASVERVVGNVKASAELRPKPLSMQTAELPRVSPA